MSKVYKTIFRLDYPISFKIIDNLGEYAEFLHSDSLQKAPFVDGKTNIDLTSHRISSTGSVDKDMFSFTLSITSLDAIIEHGVGVDVGSLSKHPVFDLANKLLPRLEKENDVMRFERIGLRTWSIIENDNFKFDRIRDYLLSKLTKFNNAIKPNFNSSEDIGIVLESKSDAGIAVRISFGPYQIAEQSKYFSLKHDSIKEGLIFDIDIWETKKEIKGLKFIELTKHYQKKMDSIIEKIKENLLEELVQK